MINLTKQPQPESASNTNPSIPKSVRRLMVLIPNLETDLTTITRRVWELASSLGASITFISLCDDAIQVPALKRRLATLTTILNYDNVSTEAEGIVGKDWLEAAKSRQRSGDIIVFLAEESGGLLQRPMSRLLQSDLDVTFYILSGHDPQNPVRPKWIAQAVVWFGFMAIILGFSVFQVKIYQTITHWTIVLALLSTAAELWLIWAWNNLFE